MTALDDALNSSSIVFGGHKVKAYWQEDDNTDIDTNVDAVGNLTDHFNGVMTVSHSLDDALPDPVTMTNGGDAGGTLTAGLNGREGLTLATSGAHSAGAVGWNSNTGATTISCPLPAGAVKGDLLITVVLINDSTATLTQILSDPKDQWELAGTISDAPLKGHVYYKRRWNTNNPQLTLMSDKPVTYMAVTNAFWARNPLNIPLDFRVTDAQLKAESASVTAHTVTSTLRGKGYQFVWFGSALGGVPSAGAGISDLGFPSQNGYIVYTGFSSTLQDAGQYTLTINQSPANAVAVMGSIAIEPYARPRMDARQYFSPFNKNSPVYGFNRDTADVLSYIRTLTATGPVDTQIFAGQMQDVPITGRSVELAAVSKTRIRMNRSVVLPVVSGYREGLTLDWLVTWLASRGSQFVGPAPNRYTRYWAPMHGSLHPHLGGQYAYSAAILYRPPGPPGGPFGYKNPTSVPGPFMSGMYAEQTATSTKRVRLYTSANFPGEPDDAFPHIVEAGGPFKFDVFSQQNSKGRISFWIRGDALTTPITYSTEDYICQVFVTANDASGNNLATIILGIDSTNRRAFVQMGSVNGGTANVSYGASGLLPTDGLWHFFGFWWDFAAGTARVNHNNSISSSDFWLTSGFNVFTDIPNFDGEAATYVKVDGLFHLPASEFMYDAGWPDPGILTANWADQYPSPTSPGQSMTMRSTGQYLSAVAEPTAVNAWDTMVDLAKASLSAYRVNELDNLEFLPLSYFGEAAQMTSSTVQDTRTNMQDVDVSIDPSKLRNNVTVKFQDSRIDANPQPVMTYTAATPIPPGVSVGVFPLDVPCVEIHGAVIITEINYQIINLTSSQISTPSLPSLRHFITANSSQDGGGTVLAEGSVSAKFIAVDALNVTIQFLNRTGATAYLVNNGDQVPFMRILGYGVRIADGYSTISDSQSVWLRGERSLESELPWIQDRATAEEIAGILSSTLARPRPEMKLTVMGNPLRKPGQLITVADAEGTGADGTWRILGIDHAISGAQYVQSLSVVQVLPVAVWDGADGWDEAVWS